MKAIALNALALALILPLTACNRSTQSDSQPDVAANTAQSKNESADSISSKISGEINKAMREAKQELANKNIEVTAIRIGNHNMQIGGDRSNGKDSRPKAEITPQGELLIAGKKVPATPAQQNLLLDYRKQIVGIAQTGIDIGMKGADLGLHAARQALWGAFTGKSDKDIEAAIKPQVDKIQGAALELCKQMPGLLSSQQKLAAALPAFRPYATMEQKDIDDCAKDMTDKNGKKGFAVFSD